MSQEDRNAMFAVSPEGLVTQARGERSWAGGRATHGVHSGKHYYEASVRDDGLVRVGWSTKAGSLDGMGTDRQSFGFGGTGKKSHNRAFDTYGRDAQPGALFGRHYVTARDSAPVQYNGIV